MLGSPRNLDAVGLAALSGVELVLREMGFAVDPGSGVAAAQRVLAESVDASPKR